MKKYTLLFSLVVLGLALPIAAQVVFADVETTVTLYNPLGDETDIRLIIGRVIKGVLSIIGSLALLMFIYGGVMWLASGGNSEMVKKGKEILLWTTLGIVVIFSSYAVVSAVLTALTTGSVSG